MTDNTPKERSRLTRALHELAWRTEAAGDAFTDFLNGDERRNAPVRIAAYAGYRTATEIRIRVRALYDRPIPQGASRWNKFRALMALYNSNELRGVEITCSYNGVEQTVATDSEGYADFALACATPLPAQTEWDEAELACPSRDCRPSTAPFLTPGADTQWAVISDIDDTVLETGATNFLKNWKRVLIQDASDRIPVPGAADLYRHFGHHHERPTRPFFYVSSSPWNLYPLITEFMEMNHIPLGPMFLKDLGIDRSKFIKTGHGEHKKAAIETLLDAYPARRFLLVGDSGQHDIDIYAAMVAKYADRFGAVIIRDVEGRCALGPKAEKLAEIRAAGVPAWCGATLHDAADILVELGLEAPDEAALAAAMEDAAAAPADLEQGQ